MAGKKRSRPQTSSEASSCSEETTSDADTSYSAEGQSDNSSTGSSSSSTQSIACRVSNLSFNQVFHGDQDSDSEEDAYQKNGKSKRRIANAMKKRCCKRKCKKQLVFKAVCFLVTSFWSLTKGGQDALLWSMQNPLWVPEEESDEDGDCNSSSVGSKTVAVSWHLEGAAGLQTRYGRCPIAPSPPPDPICGIN